MAETGQSAGTLTILDRVREHRGRSRSDDTSLGDHPLQPGGLSEPAAFLRQEVVCSMARLANLFGVKMPVDPPAPGEPSAEVRKAFEQWKPSFEPHELVVLLSTFHDDFVLLNEVYDVLDSDRVYELASRVLAVFARTQTDSNDLRRALLDAMYPVSPPRRRVQHRATVPSTNTMNDPLGASSENSEHDDMHRTLAEDTGSGLPGGSPAGVQSVPSAQEAPSVQLPGAEKQQDVPRVGMEEHPDRANEVSTVDEGAFQTVTQGQDPTISRDLMRLLLGDSTVLDGPSPIAPREDGLDEFTDMSRAALLSRLALEYYKLVGTH